MTTLCTAYRKLTGFGSVACAAPAIALSALIGGAAVGDETRSDSYAGLAPLAPGELRALRGGMSFGGLDFEFGAMSTVLVDGTPVATTTFTIPENGGLARTVDIHDPSASNFDGSSMPGGGIILGDDQSLPGIVVTDSNGISVALADISAGRIASALLNNAQGRNIRQNFETTITINNYSQLRDSVAASANTTQIMSGLQTSFALVSR